MNRRHFIAETFAGAAALGVGTLASSAQSAAQQTNVTEVVRQRGPLDPKLVSAFVGAGHNNLPRVKELVAASHTGRRDIAQYLLSQGARIDAFCAAMLGESDVLKALVALNPSVTAAKGPHGYTLLYHAAISGEVAIAEALKPQIPPNAKDYNQALSAAARDGRFEMTKWLLENGVTDPNVPDGFNKTALMFAVEEKFPEIEAVLRSHGAREKS